mgnify:CR=1 FL=1
MSLNKRITDLEQIARRKAAVSQCGVLFVDDDQLKDTDYMNSPRAKVGYLLMPFPSESAEAWEAEALIDLKQKQQKQMENTE